MSKYFGTKIGIRTVVTVLCLAAQEATPAETPDVAISHVAGVVHVIDGAVDRIGVSAGKDGVLLVDGGYMETLPQVKAAIASLGRGTPRVLINTHWHHAFANAGFADAEIIAHQAVAERLRKPNFMFTREVPPAERPGWPDTVFDRMHRVNFNGEQIDIIHFPDAHTDGDSIVIFRTSKVVMTGDIYVPHFPWIDYGAGGTLQGFLDAIDLLVEIVPPDATLVPGHGQTGSYKDLLSYRDVVRDVVEWVRTGMRKGLSLAQIQERPIPDNWKRWIGDLPLSLTIESMYKGLNENALGAACEFVNGRWFDGNAFVASAGWYSVEGVLTRKRPAVVECALNLRDRYVLPPFGEAHTHRLGTLDDIQRLTPRWLSAGVFYAMVQDPIHGLSPELKQRNRLPDAIDVVYTEGVITPSWGVLPEMYRMLATAGAFGRSIRPESLADNRYFTVDTEADLRHKWPLIKSRNQRFVKVILAFSEEFEKRKRNSKYDADPPHYSKKAGIDPQLLPQIVALAHEARLKVSAHIETAQDFRTAVVAGADYIAHLPASWQIGEQTGLSEGDLTPWMLTESDARLASTRNVIVITTVLKEPGDPRAPLFSRVHRNNLELLMRAGVRVATGSDAFSNTVVDEILALHELGVLKLKDLLRLATETTSQAIFPDRKLGRFEEGFEANFIAFEGDPLKHVDEIRRPVLHVKRGQWLRWLEGRDERPDRAH
jgi:glyoxylase-like metal-dependent hydrolase (beta-lactamase superfamily II)